MDEKILNEVGFTSDEETYIEEDVEIIELIDAITADEDELEEAEISLKDMLLNSDEEELNEVIESAYAIDIAIALEEFSDEELLAFYRRIDNEHMARILEQMDEDLQQRFVDLLDYPDILAMFKFMSNDDIADIIGEMPVNRRKNIMRMLKSKDSVDIASLLLYEDDTAGGIMTTEYIALSGKLTIEKALNKIKEIGPKTEVIDTIFVLNGKKELIGVADLRDILVAENSEILLKKFHISHPNMTLLPCLL